VHYGGIKMQIDIETIWKDRYGILKVDSYNVRWETKEDDIEFPFHGVLVADSHSDLINEVSSLICQTIQRKR
jgi:hypothetical protein